jgi:alpha-tubulin suppressor-like RCC1 family protein
MRGAKGIGLAVVTVTLLAAPIQATDYSIAAWGINGYGQTDVPAGLTNISQLAAGSHHSLALRTNGSVVAWGFNSEGQCNVPASATNITAIAAGGSFSAALRANGTVIAWGGTNWGAHTPPNAFGAGCAAIAAGTHAHGVAAYSNGVVRSWGKTAYISTPTSVISLGNVISLAAGEEHNVALLSDGTVRCWWASSFPFGAGPAITNTPSGLSNVIAIAAGYSHTLALLSNGTVVAWGQNDFGQTNVPANLTNVVKIGAGGIQSYAVTANGKIVMWGTPPFDPINQDPRSAPDSLTNVVAVAGGNRHVLALVTNPVPSITQPPRSRSIPFGWPVTFSITASGQAPLNYQWQLNGTNLPDETNASLTIASAQITNLGDYHAIVTNQFGSTTSRVATLVAGSVLAWGYNGGEQCWLTPGFTNAVSLSGGVYDTFMASADGKLSFAGDRVLSTNDLAIIPTILDARTVVSRYNSQLVTRSNGMVIALGDLGKYTAVPTAASNVISSAIAEGGTAGLVVREDGQLVCWGYSSPLTNVPPSLTNVVRVAASSRFALALRNDGTVATYGAGAPASPTNLTNVVSLDASLGFGTPYALRADGTVVTWNGSGVMSQVDGATNIVAISAGVSHLLALRGDGTVFVNGSTQSYGQGALPGALSNVVEVAAGHLHSIVRFGDGSPRITIDPYSRPVQAGSNSTLTAFAVGAPPLNYQWQFNGEDVDGATNANFILSSASLASVGGYRCLIANTSGSVTSAVANVSVVFGPPQFELLNPPPAFSSSGFSARIKGLSGTGPLMVYSSTNLAEWFPILTNPAGPTQFDFTDPDATHEPARYYRALEQR